MAVELELKKTEMSPKTTLGLNDVALLQRAVELAGKGKKDEARALVAAACLANPFNEKAWLWRASLAPSTADALVWLQRVLTLNPQHDTAKNWLARLRPPAPPPAPAAEPVPAVAVTPEAQPEPDWICPFCRFESKRAI